jgi:propanol-preferring alcohol dehydrogenase
VIPDAVSTSVHVCLTRAALSPADRVVVVGAAGGIGIHLVQVAALTGADVVGLDLSADKLTALERVGCRAVDAAGLAGLRGSALWQLGSPTAVIDLVGRPETMAWALDELGVGGRLIVLTTFRDQRLSVEPRHLVSRELSVVASRAATRAEYSNAAELVGSGRIAAVIGQVRPPEQVLEIHQMLSTGSLVGRGALKWGGEKR